MKKITALLLAVTLVAGSLMANATADIRAKKVDTDLSRVSYSDAVWNRATFFDVTLYPQTSITFNDKIANEKNAENGAKVISVAAIYNTKQIAFMLKWPDETMNIQHGYKTDSYADGFAVEFAAGDVNPAKLPYIGMGSQGRPVIIHLQKAVKSFYEPNGKGNVEYQVNPNQTALFGRDLAAFNKKVKSIGSNDYERTFVSEGFRSMTEIKDGSDISYARLGYKGGWVGTISRPLKDDYVNLNKGAIPVAFAVWDGAKNGRDGIKDLSSWVSVELVGNGDGSALIDAIGMDANGDAAAGKEAVATNGCSECHQVESTDAPSFMAPSLANIGGYSTTGYLLESLLKPSAVIVPGYNRSAHSKYQWYTEDNGTRTSTMRDYSGLDAETVNNIVTYLQTLKAEVKQ